MPDWTYRTIFKPLLTRLPLPTARRLAPVPMGRLARFPGGASVVRLFGHAAPSADMQVAIGEVVIDSPVGLSNRIDPDFHGLAAWPLLGIGLLQLPSWRDSAEAATGECDVWNRGDRSRVA